MKKLQFKCCECGHTWWSRTNPNPIQCPNPRCRSTSILTMKDYKTLVERLRQLPPISYDQLERFFSLLIEYNLLGKKFSDKLVVIKRILEEVRQK